LLNTEMAKFQGYTPRVQIFEGPKAYRIEAEVPGFRKEELSIEFPKKRLIRIAGKRRMGGPVMAELENAEGDFTPSQSVDPIEARNEASAAAIENVEPSTADSAPAEAESRAVKASEAEEMDVVKTEQSEEITFSDQWSLPEDVDIDAVKAKLDHGILSVFLPKKMQAEFDRKITIE
jgi:HSP20 family molecular chaperone IbpA